MKKEEKNTTDIKDKDNSLDPMIGDRPTVTIVDREGNENLYYMRTLGIQDTFRFLKIIAQGAAYMGGNLLDKISALNAETVAMLVLAGLPFAEKEALDLLANILQKKEDGKLKALSYEEIKDSEKFPIGSEVDIIQALMQHQDLHIFFGKLGKLVKGAPAVKAALQKEST